jgi:hypothetical protein
MKPVIVVWKDIRSEDGWRSADEMDDFIAGNNTIVNQIGFLYEQDEEQIILLDSYFLDKELFGGVHKIPRGCIISIQEL